MDEPTFRILVVKAGKLPARCFREKAVQQMEAELAALAEQGESESEQKKAERAAVHAALSAKCELLKKHGQWREVWLREPEAGHDEQISALCLVKDDELGRRFDPTREPAARCKVLVEKWNGFKQAPSMEAFRTLEGEVGRVIDEEIREWMYPSELSEDFFEALSGS